MFDELPVPPVDTTPVEVPHIVDNAEDLTKQQEHEVDSIVEREINKAVNPLKDEIGRLQGDVSKILEHVTPKVPPVVEPEVQPVAEDVDKAVDLVVTPPTDTGKEKVEKKRRRGIRRGR